MPFHDKIKQEQIQRIVSGILLHLDECSSYSDSMTGKIDEIPHVVIQKVKSEAAGLFTKDAEIKLGSVVKKNQSLGKVSGTEDGSFNIVRSPYDGIVCEMNEESRKVVIDEVVLRIGETV